VHLDCPTAEAAQDAIAALLSNDDPPTAVFAAHNATGRELVRAARAAAVDLPLVVFDEMSDSDLLIVPPQVLRSNPDRLGTTAAEMALERLDGLTVPSRLVVQPVSRVTPASWVMA